VITRHPWLDPRHGLQSNEPARRWYPELIPVAPGLNQAARIDMPDPAARGALTFVWVPYNQPSAQSPSAATTGNYLAALTSLTGGGVLYPEAGRLVATLSRDGESIAQAQVSGQLTRPDSSTAPLTFRDDGIAPDAEADDGLYSALLPYSEPGLHHVDVTFTNGSGLAEFTYLRRHYTPGPNGESYEPQPTPVGEDFSQSAGLDVMVSGFPPPGPVVPTDMTVDNFNFPGRIDAPGDQDRFSFTADQTGELVLRLTDLALGMQPNLRLYRGEPPVFASEFDVVPQGDRYFFTKLNVLAGEVFLIEVEDQDPATAGGLYNLSVGPALANSVETQTERIYLPIIGR
jgi:hypothetical protein